ncbi:Thermoresistant gluconokinase [compost metagenome]
MLTCSALKHVYRERLRSALPGLGFVFLELTPEVAADRVSHRPGHFMPSTLIDSQFATLESPVGEPLTLALDASTYSVEQLAAQAHAWWQANGLKQAV